MVAVVLLLVSCGSGTRGPRIYPYRLKAGEQFFGLDQSNSGLGVFKDNLGILYYGNFQIGNRDGYFKVIYPDGNYAFKFYKHSYAFSSASKIPGILVYKNKAMISQSNGNNSEKFHSFDQMGVYTFSKEGGKFTALDKSNASLNHKKVNDEIKAYYTGAGQYFALYKEVKNKGIYGLYKDIFKREFYGYFDEKTFEKNGAFVHSVFSKKYGIEFSKVVKEGSIYEGETKNGIPHGYGLLRSNGDKIYGWFEDGKVHGAAILKETNGDVKNGFYKNGKKDGVFLHVYKAFSYQVKNNPGLSDSVNKLNQIFLPLETWHKNKSATKPSTLQAMNSIFQNLGGLDYEIKKGNKVYYKPNKTAYQNYLYSLSPYQDEAKNFANLDDFGLYLATQYAYFIPRGDFSLSLYKKGELQKNYSIKNFHSNKSCAQKILGQTYYPDNCESPNVFGTGRSLLIQDLQMKEGKVTSGYRALYDLNSSYGYNGWFVNNLAEGMGFNFSNKNKGEFKKGKLTEMASSNKGKLYYYGNFSEGKRNGFFWVLGQGYLNQYGKYIDDKANGKFTLENGYYDLYGSSYYKDDKKQGTEKYYNADGSLRYSVTYKEGKEEGKARCYNYKLKGPENCEFKDGKRIDEKHLQRVAKKEAEEAAEKAREDERRKEQERRNREEQRRLARERAEDRARRQRNSLILQQSIQNSINSIGNVVKPTNTYIPPKSNYRSQQTYPNKSTGSSSSYSGSTLKLNSKKPYKRCIHKGSFMHMTFQAAYDCNRRAETFPAAQETVNNSIEFERKRYEKQQEIKRKVEEDKRAMDAKNDDACRQYAAKTGNYCSSACNPQRFDTRSCKAINK